LVVASVTTNVPCCRHPYDRRRGPRWNVDTACRSTELTTRSKKRTTSLIAFLFARSFVAPVIIDNPVKRTSSITRVVIERVCLQCVLPFSQLKRLFFYSLGKTAITVRAATFDSVPTIVQYVICGCRMPNYRTIANFVAFAEWEDAITFVIARTVACASTRSCLMITIASRANT
jgi:hypothetical protein